MTGVQTCALPISVIEGKASKHPELLGVFEGVSVENIKAYLSTPTTSGYFKIMTTPEGYRKVHSAITHTIGSPYKD